MKINFSNIEKLHIIEVHIHMYMYVHVQVLSEPE